ncbi:magnesium transporter [Nitrosococcus halophilus Nc 4]|uniref:Magnesium transporter MgtE n=1 Tax=Nitrosococcus halophilus (strain Nc4) TaxID=472759 RepID=D5BUX2_NITHN|nr:magnesium transporter [Nitrosococcus halophilus]ADE13522.1 magnesium transporter [Nitrosococcus halophilus Nc 4]
MLQPLSPERNNERLNALVAALESGRMVRLRRLLSSLHPAEVAHLLESLPPPTRHLAWQLVGAGHRGEVLSYVGDEVRSDLMSDIAVEDLASLMEDLDPDDLADILRDLPETVVEQVLQTMDAQNRRRLETVLSYPEDTAGGLMNTDTITIRGDITLDVVHRYLRLLGALPEATDSLFVVDRDDNYQGVLLLTTLLTRKRELTVAEVMSHGVENIPVSLPTAQVAQRFEKRDLISAPVVDEEGKLLGRITIDDVVDVIRDEADHSLMSMAGLTEDEDTFAPVLLSLRRRSLWLGINLITAFLAAWVIGLFEATIQKQVALAVLMPIVASMGGIAGSQTLTLVIRAMALGQLSQSNTRWLLSKELTLGVLNGLLWALVIGIVAATWFKGAELGILIGAAIIINLIFAALSGVVVPLFLRRIGADPALAGGVLLTTITDVVGFMAFLGFATLYLI